MKKIKTVLIPSISTLLVQLFDFKFRNSDDISKIIDSLDRSKMTTGAIPTKIVKLANKQICKDLENYIYECIKQIAFPNRAKNSRYNFYI